MAATNRPRVYLDVNIGEEPAGRLTIELFTDKTPKTCENFRQLCTGEHNGLSYTKTPFHRIIDEFMIQGGDIKNGDGTGITSIYEGEQFEDENLDWREMDTAGLICSANRGKDTNGSQFFITLTECSHLNGKHTIFGRLVSGEDTLRRIASVAVDKNDRPVDPVLVSRCGELERKKKTKHDSIHDVSMKGSNDDRGRRRKSDPSDDEMDVTPPPRAGRRSRRQSETVVDEGLRGRPRLRSHSRSASNPIEEETEPSDHSPVKKHKRKRSQSPSRHLDRREEAAAYERRRRSLPNQYKDGRDYDHDRVDGDRYRPSPRRGDSHKHRDDYAGRRAGNDRYRPGRSDEGRLDSGGRLGGGGSGGGGGEYDDYDPPVKFKGRGVMKYREPGRL